MPDDGTGGGPLVTTVRTTTAAAIVSWLVAQRTRVDGVEAPLFPGVLAIFGHGNVTCLGHSLHQAGDALPTWRAQNEQGMALAAVAYAKATRRRQVMVATSSVGPGATNMVTAAGVAMANRLPVLMLVGDTFAARRADPVLQQVEHPSSPSTTVNTCFGPVSRYWDRIVRPAQLVSTLPQVLRVLLDPAECGPAVLALPQDVQGEAWDFPASLFAPAVNAVPRPRADVDELERAAALLRGSERPLIVAGGGVHYSQAEEELARFATAHGVPVVETVAGRSSLVAGHPLWAGPLGVTGWDEANRLAALADVVVAVGTRLQDFTTGSGTVFGPTPIVALNVSRFDAVKHGCRALVGDARATLAELDLSLDGWAASSEWVSSAAVQTSMAKARVAKATAPGSPGALPTYAQVVGAVNRAASADDYVLTAAGGLPGELNANWSAHGVATFDCEYGFSCMGYEIAGGWGAAMARAAGSDGSGPGGSPTGDVFVLVGDGSYLMLNSELYSSVRAGHKMIVVVCDNGGFAVIERLQLAQGGASFNNMLDTSRQASDVRVDFAAHAAALGCISETVEDVAALEAALVRARAADRTSVIVIGTDPQAWSQGGAFWEVGVPEVSDRPEVRAARQQMDNALKARDGGER